MFAICKGEITSEQMTSLGQLAENAKWRDIPGREYQASEDIEFWFWETCKRAFFIRIPPKCSIKPHTDSVPGTTEHWVLKTNDHCLNWWKEGNEDHSIHLEVGHRYTVQREPIHWATNDGDTDRIHLLVEHG